MTDAPPLLRRLGIADIPDAMSLKDAAGWNQTEADWRLSMELEPGGCYALERAGRVIATSTALPHGKAFGWVGMVLVHPDERGKGHGTRMLDEAVDYLSGRGVVPALDATPLGRPLYERRGFVEVCQVERRVGTAPWSRKPDSRCEPLEAAGVGELRAIDLESFGADRGRLLTGILLREGSWGFLFRSPRGVEGFIFGRAGTRFFHLGPWVAATEEAAQALWDTALSGLGGRTLGVDVLVPNEAARSLAGRAGLPVVRTLSRMCRTLPGGPADAPVGGRPDRVFALAGLEWG